MARGGVASVLGGLRISSIRPLLATDLPWAEALVEAELGGRMQARRGELIDAFGDGGLVAEIESRPVGLVCWRLEPDSAAVRGRPESAEVTCLVIERSTQGRGVGRALLDGADAALRERGVARVWLVTTNDNLGALALYQKAGYRLVELRPGAVDESRRTLKPSIPKVSSDGIPIRDELELERHLDLTR